MMAAPMRCHLQNNVFKHLRSFGRASQTSLCGQSTTTSLQENEEPQYPPIKPRLPPGVWGDTRPRWAWQQHERGEELKSIPKAKERLEELAHNEKASAYKVKGLKDTPRVLDYKKYITKTHLVNELPETITKCNVDELAAKLQPVIEEAIIENHNHVKVPKLNDYRTAAYQHHELMSAIFNSILAKLAADNDYLRRAQVDEYVRIEAFWSRGGFSEQYALAKDHIGVARFNYKGLASFQLRSEMPLPEFVPSDDPLDDLLSSAGYFPALSYGPHAVGQHLIHDKPTSISGHWIGDPCEFHLMTWLMVPRSFREKFTQRTEEECYDEQILQYGITSSFASCVAQSHNQGFNRYLDITYPFTTQTVLSDGQHFRFFAYQLNSLHIWRPDDAWKVQNMCWASSDMKLFDSVEASRVVGFNPDVLRILLQMFLNQPQDRGVDLRPYLPEEESPSETKMYVNVQGEPAIERPVIGRFQYRADSVYF